MPSGEKGPKSGEFGWFPDPDQPGQERLWNGSAWTRTRPAQSVDPDEPDPEADQVRLGWILVAAAASAIVVIVVLMVVFLDSDSVVEEDDQAEFDEVSLTSCDPPGLSESQSVGGIVENGSSQSSDNAIDVSVMAPDGTRIGTGSTRVEDVDAGGRAVWSAETDTRDDDWVDGASCEVTGVERTLAR